MSDWSKPTLTSNYSDFVAEVKGRDDDLAKQFDGTTSPNVPIGTIKWNSSNRRHEKWNGSAWAELVPKATTAYSIRVEVANDADMLGGQLPSYYTDISGRLGYTPLSTSGGAVTGGFGVSGSYTAYNNNALTFGSDAGYGYIQTWGNRTLRLNPQGNSVEIGSSAILHSGNYNTYAPTLTGGNASGTWSINVSGSAGSLSGFNNPTTQPTPNTMVYRDAAGDISAREIVLSSGLSTAKPTVLVSMYPTTNQMVRTSPSAVAGALYDVGVASGWVHSVRHFVNGTLIQTDINYAGTNGDPFVLEIRGNSYGNAVPLDIQYQGYIYADTIINHGGYSNGTNISGLVAINYNGNLCFWFPSQSYWQGYCVRVYVAYNPYPINRVTSILDSTKPTSAKQVNLNPVQSLHSANYASFLDGVYFNTVGNCAGQGTSSPAINCYGSGNILSGYRHELQDAGGQVALRTVNWWTNCNCNCDCSCVPAGTLVTLSDGSQKAIELVEVGDIVATRAGLATVRDLWRPRLGDRALWSINGLLQITGDHLIATSDGWRCIEPHAFASRVAAGIAPKGVEPRLLAVGDEISTDAGLVTVRSIDAIESGPETQLFSLFIDEAAEFYANGVVVDGMLTPSA